MPLYEYACPTCRANFELLIRASDVAACPTCGSERVAKLLSVPAAHVANGASLPTCAPPMPSAGGCGRPQCGGGFCAGN
jgi:putative FmdB family regulatory protein